MLERQYRKERRVDRARLSRLVGERAGANGSFQLSFTVPKPPQGYYLLGSNPGDPTIIHAHQLKRLLRGAPARRSQD